MTQISAPKNAIAAHGSQSSIDLFSLLLRTFIGFVAIINAGVIVFIAVDFSIPLSIAMIVLDLGLVVAMFWLDRILLVAASIVMGIILALGLAIWFAQGTAPAQPIYDGPGQVVSPEIQPRPITSVD